MFRIVEKTELAAGIFRMRVEAPRVAASALPGDPCGECEICRGIDNGSILDVVEMDAASNNGALCRALTTLGIRAGSSTPGAPTFTSST